MSVFVRTKGALFDFVVGRKATSVCSQFSFVSLRFDISYILLELVVHVQAGTPQCSEMFQIKGCSGQKKMVKIRQ